MLTIILRTLTCTFRRTFNRIGLQMQRCRQQTEDKRQHNNIMLCPSSPDSPLWLWMPECCRYVDIAVDMQILLQICRYAVYGDCILLFHKVPTQPASKMSAPCTTAADRPMFCEGSCVIIQLCNTQHIYSEEIHKLFGRTLDSSTFGHFWCGKMKYGRV